MSWKSSRVSLESVDAILPIRFTAGVGGMSPKYRSTRLRVSSGSMSPAMEIVALDGE